MSSSGAKGLSDFQSKRETKSLIMMWRAHIMNSS